MIPPKTAPVRLLRRVWPTRKASLWPLRVPDRTETINLGARGLRRGVTARRAQPCPSRLKHRGPDAGYPGRGCAGSFGWEQG
jgi:hypothetical protein